MSKNKTALIGHTALRNRIGYLSVKGNQAMHCEVWNGAIGHIAEHGDSSVLVLYANTLQDGMVGKPKGLTFKNLIEEIGSIDGVHIMRDGKQTTAIKGLSKGTQLREKFWEAYAKDIVKKTPSASFESTVKRLSTLEDGKLTKAQMIAIVERVFKAKK